MDLKSCYPFWAIKNGLMCAFPALKENIEFYNAVIGGGITGAMIADELSANGAEVAIIEWCDIGWGSSAVSTALLQYEIDVHLLELAKLYGEVDALLVYHACEQATKISRGSR